MKKLIFSIICVLLLVGCGSKDIDKPTTMNDTLKFKEEYEAYNGTQNLVTMDIKEDMTIKYLKATDILPLLKEGTGIIYFGFPTCPWCRNAVPVLLEAASTQGMTVSYINTREIRKENKEEMGKIIEYLSEYLEEDEYGKKALYVPDVYFVKDGQIVGHHLGTVDSQTNPTIPLTVEQKEELTKVFTDLIGKIK